MRKTGKKQMSKKSAVLDQTNMDIWDSLVSSGDLAAIQNMVRKSKISTKDKLGEYELSPLHLAAKHNQPDICEFLISEGVSPNIKESFSKKNPLHIAAYLGHLEAAQTLLRCGWKASRTKAEDILHCLPIHYAAMGEKKEMISLLLRTGYPGKFLGDGYGISTTSCLGNCLDILIRKRNLELVDFFSASEGISSVEANPRLTIGINLFKYQNELPWTPFHSAAVMGNMEMVELLFNRFPHAYCFCEEFRDSFACSPAEVALAEGHTEIARMLGDTRSVESCRQDIDHLFVQEDEIVPYAQDLLDAIRTRNFAWVDKLLAEWGGDDIFYEQIFYEDYKSSYRKKDKLTAFSAISRSYAFSFSEFFQERDISIADWEFIQRDSKEQVFFNWTMMEKVSPFCLGWIGKSKGKFLRPI